MFIFFVMSYIGSVVVWIIMGMSDWIWWDWVGVKSLITVIMADK